MRGPVTGLHGLCRNMKGLRIRVNAERRVISKAKGLSSDSSKKVRVPAFKRGSVVSSLQFRRTLPF